MTIERRYYYDGATLSAKPKDYDIIPPTPVTPRLAVNASPIGVTIVTALIGEAGTGRLLGEVFPEFEHVIWSLNEYGDAAMTFAATDPAITGGLVRPGRRVALLFDNGLPPWGGVLGFPVEISSSTVKYVAYEAPYLLTTLLTGENDAFTSVTPGQIVSTLIANANARYPTGFEARIDDDATAAISIVYSYLYIWDVLTSDVFPFVDTYTEPVISDRITFRLHVSPKLGRDISDRVALIEGVNCDFVNRQIQGDLANSVYVSSSNSAWDTSGPDLPRLTANASDTFSIQQYGPYERAMTLDATSMDALESYAAAEVERRKAPYTSLTTNALNLSPGTFSQYGIGDTVTVEAGYDGEPAQYKARVIGRQLNVAEGVCSLVLR